MEGVKKKVFNVIVIEDSIDDLIFIRRQLFRLDWEINIRTCYESLHFSMLLKTTHPDLVLSDYKLPGWSGLEALLMSKDRYPDVPFFFVSGAVSEPLAENSALNQADGYVLKSHISELSAYITAYFRMEKHTNYVSRQRSKNEAETPLISLLKGIRAAYHKREDLGPYIDKIDRYLG